MKKFLALLFPRVMVFSIMGCGNTSASSSVNSDPVERTVAEVHEYTIYDLDGLITGIGDVAVIRDSNVDLLALVTYDDTVITDITLDDGLLDYAVESSLNVTYTITADTSALNQILGLEGTDEADETVSFDVSVKVYVIAEDTVAEFQTKHPEVPVYTNDNVLYAPAEVPQAEVTAAPENTQSDSQTSETDHTSASDSGSASGNPSESNSGSTGNNAESNQTSGNTSSETNPSTNQSGASSKPENTGTTSNNGSSGGSNSNSNNGSSGSGASNNGSSGANSGSAGTSSGNGSSTGNTSSGGTGTGGNGSGSQTAHKHSYTSKVTKAATCSTAGVRTYTCSCGDSYTESIPATGNHSWVEVTSTVHHDETGHYETRTVSEAWDEAIKEGKAVCNYAGCGAYYDTADEVLDHIFIAHDGHASYSVKKVTTGTIHHDAVTEEVWVVDQAAYDETVVTGYKCSVCGATQ